MQSTLHGSILHSLSGDIDDFLEHTAAILEPLDDVRLAAEVSDLQQAVGDGLPLRVDVRHEVVVRLRAHDDLRVVLEEIHLQCTNGHARCCIGAKGTSCTIYIYVGFSQAWLKNCIFEKWYF